jgi:hypothetical protein
MLVLTMLARTFFSKFSSATLIILDFGGLTLAFLFKLVSDLILLLHLYVPENDYILTKDLISCFSLAAALISLHNYHFGFSYTKTKFTF